jgi:hypothetical protein
MAETPGERLTYADATPEQVADARRRAQARLADAERRHDTAYWDALRDRFGITTTA